MDYDSISFLAPVLGLASLYTTDQHLIYPFSLSLYKFVVFSPPFTLFLCVVVVAVVGCGPHPAVNYHLTGELPL